MGNPIDDYDGITQTVRLYIDGSARGDAGQLEKAFHADARMFGEMGGRRMDLPIAKYIANATKRGANSEGNYRARIVSVEQFGDIATAILIEDGFWGTHSFLDVFSLSRADGAWKIVNKTFAHTGG